MPNPFVELLKPERIRLHLRAENKAETVRELAAILAPNLSPSKRDEMVDLILAREARTSTLAENGVAFPHARSELCGGLALALGRSVEGIPWNDDGARAHLIFLLCVPQKMVNDYLVVIGAIARATRDDPLRTLLLHAETLEEFIAILRDAPSI